jgi:hypothetical protein
MSTSESVAWGRIGSAFWFIVSALVFIAAIATIDPTIQAAQSPDSSVADGGYATVRFLCEIWSSGMSQGLTRKAQV